MFDFGLGDHTNNNSFLHIILIVLFQESSLVSSLGGALSLYLGIAIIMCVELLELIFDLIINVWCHLAKKG